MNIVDLKPLLKFATGDPGSLIFPSGEAKVMFLKELKGIQDSIRKEWSEWVDREFPTISGIADKMEAKEREAIDNLIKKYQAQPYAKQPTKLDTLANHIRKLAAEEITYHMEEAKIFFSAPNPHKPRAKSLTIDKETPMHEANFQWVAFQILFSIKEGEKEPRYYIYSTGLEPNGDWRDPDVVFESDSKGSGEHKGHQTPDIQPGQVRILFPNVLKDEEGPNLHPTHSVKTTYINVSQDDKAHEYSSDEFKLFFETEGKLFYIVLDLKSDELRNPSGALVGKKGEPSAVK